MNGFGQDIDNKHPFPWKMPKFQPAAKTASTKAQLLDAVESSLKEFTAVVYGDHNDQKYSRLVDLIMLRFKSDLTRIPDTIQFSEDTIKDLVTQALNDAYDSDESILKYDDAAKDIVSKLKLLANADDNDNTTHEETTYADTTKSNSKKQKVDDVVQLNDVASKQLQKLNDFICSMAIEVGKQFAKLEEMMMQHFAILSPNKYDSNVIDTVERLKSLQLGPVAIDIKSQKKAAKRKQKAVDIIVAGMKFSSKMIDTLSTSAIKTVMHSAITVKQHYDSLSTALCIIELYVKEKLKYTTELVYDAFGGGGFLNWIKKFIGRIVNFVVDKLVKPLKNAVIDILKIPLIDMIMSWLVAHEPDIVKRVMARIHRFQRAARKAFRVVRRIWRKARRWIRRATSNIIKWFTKAIGKLNSWFISTLKFFWRLIWGGIKLLAKGTWWLVKRASSLARAGWRALMKTKFGQKLAEIGGKIAKPFKVVGGWIKTGYIKAKTKIIDITKGIAEKGRVFVDYVKNHASKFAQKAREAGTKLFQLIKQWFAKSLQFVVKMICKAINKLLFGLPGKIITAISTRIASHMSRKALQKSGRGFILRALRWLGSKIAKLFSKMSIGGLLKATGKIFSGFGRFGLKALPIIGWYLLLRDVIDIMYDCENKWLLRQMKLGHISYEDKFWIEKLIGFCILKFVTEFLINPKRLWESIARFVNFLSGKWMDAFESVHNAYLKQETTHELLDEVELRRKLYENSHTPSTTCIIPSLAEINDVNKEFEFIHSKFKTATKIYNDLKATVARMYDDYIRMQQGDNTYGNPADDYWDAKLWYSKQITQLLETIMATGIDNFTGGDLTRLLKYDVSEDDLMLIYHEMMCAIDYIEWWKANEDNRKRMLEQLSQFKEFYKTHELDIDALQDICKQQQDQQQLFYKNARDLKDFIVNTSKNAIQQFNAMIYGDESEYDSEVSQFVPDMSNMQ